MDRKGTATYPPCGGECNPNRHSYYDALPQHGLNETQHPTKHGDNDDIHRETKGVFADKTKGAVTGTIQRKPAPGDIRK
jgi:hypothetical protein